MATYTGKRIKDTYESILKLEDNENLTSSTKKVTDGLGNQTPLSISSTEVKSSSDIEATGFKTPTGTSSEFLKADGSVDTNTYLTSYTDTNTTYTAGNGLELEGTTFQINGGVISGGANLDDYDESGYYTQNSNANATSGSNYPEPRAGVLTVVVADDNTVHKTQTYDIYNSSAFYNRSYYSGTWSSWRNLAQDTDTNTQRSDAEINLLIGNYTDAKYLRSDADDTTTGTLTASGLTLSKESSGVTSKELIFESQAVGSSNISEGHIYTYSGDDYNVGMIFGTQSKDDSGNEFIQPSFRINDIDSDVNFYHGIEVTDGVKISGGTSSQFLKADGTLDSNTYLTSSGYLLNTTDTLTGDLTVTGNLSSENSRVSSTAPRFEFDETDRTDENWAIITSGGNFTLRTANSTFSTFSNKLTVAQTGNATFAGAVTASNLSGSNTGDQDLSGYLLNTTDTLTGNLGVTGTTTSSGYRTSAGNTTYSLIARDSQNNSPLYVQSANSNTDQPIAIFNYGSNVVNQGSNVLTVAKDKSYFQNTNVGIGTNSPSFKLDLGDSTDSNNAFRLNGNFSDVLFSGNVTAPTGGVGLWNFINTGTNATKRFYVQDANNNNSRLTFDFKGGGGAVDILAGTSSGNVGIGTDSPSQKLQISGSGTQRLYISETSGGTNTALKSTSSAGYVGTDSTDPFYIQTDNTNRIAIDTSGNVGIGRDDPFYKLDVNGNGRFVSDVTATNFILSSDKRLKNNVEDADNKHIDVNWKTFEMNSEEGQLRYGVVAQELEEVHPEFVRTDDEGMKSVAYVDLLIAKNAELEARIERLEKLLTK